MLKKISPILSPDLLKVLAEMGHGDEIVIGDGNFPAASMGKRCIRLDGHSATEVLNAILDLFPLDQYVDCPVVLMELVPKDAGKGRPEIWNQIEQTVKSYEPDVKIGFEERFAFYERSQKAYACIQTGETAQYACILLKKGIIV